MTEVLSSAVTLLTKIQMEVMRKVKIENSTLCNDHENGGRKNVDIFSKNISLQ